MPRTEPTHRPRRPRWAGLGVLAVLLLAGCTGGSDDPGPTPSGAATGAPPAAFCSGTLAGPGVVALLGPGRIRESGVPQLPRPGQLASECELRGGDLDTTLTLATAAAEVSGRVTLQGIANNNPGSAVPIASGATGLVDPGFAWLARPCLERRTLLASLRLTTSATTPGTADRQQLTTLLLTATAKAATAAGCDRGATPAAGALPAAPTPAPAGPTVCGVPAAAVTPVTGPLTGWTATTPLADADAPARTCELTGPNGAVVRFVVSRGAVAANAGTLPIGATTAIPELAGANAGPGGARFDRTCGGIPTAYRLRLTNLTARTPGVAALFTALVRGTTVVGCPG